MKNNKNKLRKNITYKEEKIKGERRQPTGDEGGTGQRRALEGGSGGSEGHDKVRVEMKKKNKIREEKTTGEERAHRR